MKLHLNGNKEEAYDHSAYIASFGSVGALYRAANGHYINPFIINSQRIV